MSEATIAFLHFKTCAYDTVMFSRGFASVDNTDLCILRENRALHHNSLLTTDGGSLKIASPILP
jgi:hypothetical protein